MTREEIIANWTGMTARQRDAWVAEVVFGWERTSGVIDAILPYYTTDISAAWVVFESFSDFRIQRYETISRTFRYGCRLDWEDASASAETAPEAICLAALIASLQSDERETELTEVSPNEAD